MSSHLVLQLPMQHLSGAQRHRYVGGFLLEGIELHVKMAQLLLCCEDVVLPAIMLAWAGLNLVFS